MKQINFILNEQQITVPEGTTILEGARSVGIVIPTLCYHRALGPSGFCRLCIVAIETSTMKDFITTSCNCEAKEGMRVSTETERLKKMRLTIMELLSSGTNNSSDIKRLTLSCSKNYNPLNKDDCILCGLCVKVCRNIIKACALSMDSIEGGNNKVAEYVRFNEANCIGCGACASLCPVGAIKVVDKGDQRRLYLYNNRKKSFELLVCSSCSSRYTTFEHREFVLKRIDSEEKDQLRTLCPECAKRYHAASLSVFSPLHKELFQ